MSEEKLKNEAILLIKDLLDPDKTEFEVDSIYEKISLISPDPEWSFYIFQSMEFYNKDDELDIEAVVDKIFSYKPISL